MRADLRTGRGTENVLFNLLRYAPENMDITIVESDNLQQTRISDQEIKKITSRFNVIKIHKHLYKMDSLSKRIYVNTIVRPYYRDLEWAKSKGLLEDIRNTDMVYLFANEYSIFFKDMSIPIIGSGHAFTISDFVNRQDLPHKLYANYLYKTYFKNINGFNYFPKDGPMFNKFKDMWNLNIIFLYLQVLILNYFIPIIIKLFRRSDCYLSLHWNTIRAWIY